MRDFSEELKKNEELKNGIEVAKAIRDKALCEMAKDVHAILKEVFYDATKYINYSGQYEFGIASDLGQLGITNYFFRRDSVGRYIKINDIRLDFDNEVLLKFNGTCINVSEENLVAFNEDKSDAADWKLKQFFKAMDTVLKFRKDRLVELTEYIIQKKLEEQKKDLEKKFEEISCSVSK